MSTRRRRVGAHPHRVEVEAPLRFVLDNGLVVRLCPRAYLSHAYVAVFFGVGSRHETPETNGITHILEHMVFRGSKRYADATALNAAAETFGGFLEGATYRDHLTFATGCHPTAVLDAIEVLDEIVRSSRYRHMEVERAILREELLETLDVDGRMVDLDNIAHRAVFGRHGLGLPIEGTLENLERATMLQLESHRERYLVGRNGVLSIAGPMDVDRVMARLRRTFGRLPAGAPAVSPPPAERRADPLVRYVRDAASQVDLRITFPAVPAQDPEYPALVLLARLLADGLASRMHAELVDRKGLAYSLHAGLTTYSDCGLFDFEVAVAPDRAAEAVEAILGFAAASSRFRFNGEELQRTRRRYRYGLEFMSDSPADLANWHGRAALFGVERELEQLSGRIHRLDDSATRHAARRVFRRGGLVVTAVGELAAGQLSRVRSFVGKWNV